MSRDTDLAVLLSQENMVVQSMMDVRYDVENFRRPKPQDMNRIREVSDRFIKLAQRIHEDDEKKEAERNASEY